MATILMANDLSYIAPAPWDNEQLQWAKRFDIVEAGSFEDIDRAKTSYPHTYTYQWLVGFYAKHPSAFDRWILKEHLTLNEEPINGIYFYDLCSERVIAERTRYLASECKKRKIEGIFFDWANDLFLEDFPSIQKTLRGKKYRACIHRFFKRLRQEGLHIVTNQAFRNPGLLDTVDMDMSESYISTDTSKPSPVTIDAKIYSETPCTLLYPTATAKRDIHETFAQLQRLSKLANEYNITMIYMNYAAPKLQKSPTGYHALPPKEIIHYNFAFAKLFGAMEYTEVPFDRHLEEDEIYFTKLGKPTEPIRRYEDAYIRRFEKGFVIVSSKDVNLHTKRRLFDLFEKKWLEPGSYSITRYYDTITKEFLPIGRVFVYDRASGD